MLVKQLLAGAVVAATVGTGAAAAMDSAHTDVGTNAAAAEGRRSDRHMHVAAIRAVAEELGLDPSEIVSHLRDGGTIADLAEQEGVDPAALEASLVARTTEAINDAAANGMISEERAAGLLGRVPAVVHRFVTEPHERAGRHHRGRERLRELATVVADAIGIEPGQLRDELAGGGSIAGVATAHGVDPGDVESALLAAIAERIEAAVAAGNLDQARTAEIRERAAERIHDLVTKERPAHD